MMDWTPGGLARFEAYIDTHRQGIKAEGADPEEVASDLKAHIEMVVKENGRTVVTETDVVNIAGQSLGDPAAAAPGGTAPGAEPDTDRLLTIRVNQRAKTSPGSRVPGILSILWISLFGILLPSLTLGLELLTRMCAATLFDPLPTAWHAVVVALVPIIHTLILISLLGKREKRWGIWGSLAGVAAGISLYYALQFLPFVPFAIIGIVFGIGILPLSPLLAFLVYFTLRSKIRTRRSLAGGASPARTWPGLLAAFVLLMALDVPKVATYTGLIMATSENSATVERGIGVLRRGGSKDHMLRLCYQRPGIFSDVMGMLYCASGNAPSPREARRIYYRTFGEPFNAQPPPALRGARGRTAFDWDPGVAGDAVDGRLSSLSLASSRLDASIDADGGVAYTEWTLEFKNDGYSQQEARMQVRLPGGGVVSRLTLWVDGEPREAAFAGRSEVKTAYKNVVSRRRDPVLVTTSGPDQVLVQCFPVPPDGGIMKIRFGVTAPVNPLSSTEASVAFPWIIERNFTIPAGFTHAVWAESPNRLAGGEGASVTREAATGLHALRGRIADHVMRAGLVLNAERTADISFGWTLDERAAPPRWIIQKRTETIREKPAGLVVVIDGSRPMRAQAERLAEELGAASPGCPVSLILAADTPVLLADRTSSPAEIRNALDGITYIGGMDGVPALLMALDLAARQGNSPILWLHGPQPVELAPSENIAQYYDRREGTTPVIDGRLISGGNLVATALHQIGALRSPRDDITAPGGVTRLVEKICGVREQVTWRRESQYDPPPETGGKQTSDHLARLFARDEIARLLDSRDKDARGRATEIAASYQLVTPVSGAVVLENARQYKQAGLEPVGEDTVPTIPEPETWAMLIIVAVILAGAALKNYRRAPAA
ncbi:MAG: VIT domain-containing protein [Lentisphaeria bacterium]|nr:VIT domain-containing protein [Lentisphaeria bacterium]